MVDYTKFAKFYVAVSTLVALACTVGFVVMVATMPQCPHLTNFKCPTTEGHTSQPLRSIGPYGITPPLLDSTDIVLEDFVTSLTMSEVYEAKTKTKQGSITRREPHGKNVPFPDPDSINDDGEFPSPVTSDAGNPDVKPQPETSSTTSPEADGFIEQLIRSLLSMMNDPDLQNLEDQHLLNIMLINIVNATYSRHTHRMEAETEAIRQNTSNNVQKIRKPSGKSFLPSFRENFSDGGEEMESENKSTVNIAKMVNGLATSSHDGYVNKADTYNLDVEKHSSGTESVEVDDSLNEINKFMLDLNRAVSGTGYANTDDLFNETKSLTLAIERQVNNGVQSIHDSPLSKTLKIVIDKRVIGVATPDINDSLNKTAIFKVNIKKEVSGQGYSDSIYSSGGAELFEISIEKTVTGIPFLNTTNQAIDESHVFELDITKVMEEIAASDVLDELDNVNANFNINVESQLNGLGHSNSIDSSSDDDISEIDIQKTTKGIGFANTKTQAIDEAHVFELDITKVMEEIAASDVLDELDNVNANFNINVESQLNGLGHSNSIDSSSDDDISEIDIQKTTKGIGFANTKTQAIDEAHVFELDITKVMEEIAASDVLDELDNVNANFNINIESQLNGLGHSNSIDSSSDDDISEIDIQKTTKGIGFANTKTQAIDEAQVFELDISKEMKAIASLDPTDHSDNVNAAVKVNIEKQLNGLGHSDSMNSSSGNQISYVDMEKTVNGIGLSHDNKSDNDDTHIFKLDVDKDMRGIASSGVFLYPHNSTTELDVGKTAIGIAFSNNQNAGDVRNKKPELNLQKQVVGIASANREQPNNFDKEITGISSSYTNNENSNDANDLKLDIGKVMEGVAASNVFNDSHYHMERKNVGVASSSTRTSSNGKTVEPKLYIQKQAVGIAAANTKQSSSHPGKNQH
ncbi:uncharacterized protein LOC123467389 [Daphnia magna]|uniref:uncharacterized protein LOC123467389 n=1 Tax=Daphnia magna TaxID=35525 RepID=UPI001E1BC2FF|nr:uncharacterized protein LOC123467389 [Daphnia magna]